MKKKGLLLKWKMLVIFGTLSIFAVITASLAIYFQAINEFNRQLGEKLSSIAIATEKVIDRKKLSTLSDVRDPYYQELRTILRNICDSFNIAWVALYRYNGLFFVHIADGSEPSEGFVLDYPIFDSVPEMHEAWKGKTTITSEYVDAYDSWFSAFHPVRNDSSEVIAILDISENNRFIRSFRASVFKRTANVVILIGLLTVIACFLFAVSLSRPLARLTEGARELAQGNLATRVTDVKTGGEIGELIFTFNDMAEKLMFSQEALARKIFELSTLYQVSQKVNFARDTIEILRIIMEKSIEALQADRGSVMLYDEDRECLAVEVVAGEGAEWHEKQIEIKSGEGVAGKVFQDMKPLLLNSKAELEKQFKPYDFMHKSDISNILCVPLIVENRAIGVLNVVNKKEGEFTEGDLSLLTTMAAEMALAIEKARLYELSITDGLTGLYIHRYFQLSMERELKRARRYGSPLSLILFDIDYFKKFNDTYGHQMGDLVLMETARLLKKSLRDVDIPARYGGEEFAVILPETEAEAAFAVAERIRTTVEAHDYPGQEKPVKVTISLGIASFPLHATEKNDLIKKADEALYSSKKRGRNCATIYMPGFESETEPV